jgi:tRNA1Val (adenine37-N6)-methyltransferase
MKVGTDSTLLGAMVLVKSANSILDIGTGTGIIALMLAQRNDVAKITTIEIDNEASKQAAENVATSPWKDRINIITGDFNHYQFLQKFDCIVSNPPFYTEDLKCHDPIRNMARHTDSLTFDALLRQVHLLLSDIGSFTVIIPSSQVQSFVGIAYVYGLYLFSQITIYSRLGKASKRSILAFSATKQSVQQDVLVIHSNDGTYTAEFKALMHNFYLYL